jgi:hypothetical protein
MVLTGLLSMEHQPTMATPTFSQSNDTN